MQCSGCAFWREGQDHASGECHRKAPAPVVALGDVVPDVWWPKTDNSDGCGEFEERFQAAPFDPGPQLATMTSIADELHSQLQAVSVQLDASPNMVTPPGVVAALARYRRER